MKVWVKVMRLTTTGITRRKSIFEQTTGSMTSCSLTLNFHLHSLPAGVATHGLTFPDVSSYPLPDLAVPLHRAYTFSTNATADGLPGPGRGLDQLYQLGGRKLERAMNAMAMRAGLGPENAEKRVRKALERVELRREEEKSERKERWVWSWMRIDGEARARRDVNRGCKRLVEYTSYVRHHFSPGRC